jgi:hypothetical protein
MTEAIVTSTDTLLDMMLHELDCLAALRRLYDAGREALVELDRLAREPETAHLDVDVRIIQRLREALVLAEQNRKKTEQWN